MKSGIPFSGKGAKTQQKHGPFPPSVTEKKQKVLDLTRRGKSNDIAHRLIIQVFTVAHRHWTRGMWRRKAMWGDEISVERGGGKRRKCVFRYPNEKWNKDCVEPTTRRGERGISQMMSGFFYGQTHDLFLPVFHNPSSARGRVTGKSIINFCDDYDFLGIWENIREKVGEEEVFFIIDNAKTHLPFRRWLRRQGIAFKEIPASRSQSN